MAFHKAVIGLVASQTQAVNIIRTLQIGGFSDTHISVLFPLENAPRDLVGDEPARAPRSDTAGAASGGGFGGTFGLALDLGAVDVAGFGPVVAAGPVLAALSGAASRDGLLGVLLDMGLPEFEARQYRGKIHGGDILMSVQAPDARGRTRAKYAMENGGATDIVTIGEQTVPIAAWDPPPPVT